MKPQGTLYIVATPIGNLEDMTFRAVRVLQDVSLILCENKRNSISLFKHFAIETPSQTLYGDRSGENHLDWVVEKLRSGDNIAYVSDAGTPGISDPGSRLVRLVRDAKIAVVPIPGASALTSILSISGSQTSPTTFLGFLPEKKGKRRRELQAYENWQGCLVLYESMHRVKITLAMLKEVFPLAEILVGREITKKYEEYLQIANDEEANLPKIKGEFTILVNNHTKKITKDRNTNTDIQS
ncbi:MAG: 16S rRNA (cytidine(1402)-2'-O)-methyltransferase [Spirochaetota bacterium]